MKTYITIRTGETLESNMGDIHTWPVEYALSKHAISELEKIDELVGIQYLVACIAAVGKFYGQRPLDAEFVTGLRKVRESLMHAASTLESLGPWAARVILTPDGIYNNRRGGYYFEWEDRSYHLETFVERAFLYQESIAKFLDNHGTNEGRSPNYSARNIARQLAELFDEEKKHISTYQNSAYMQTLRILFTEIFPNIGAEAFRRHGLWAVKHLKKLKTK